MGKYHLFRWTIKELSLAAKLNDRRTIKKGPFPFGETGLEFSLAIQVNNPFPSLWVR